jgi:hypothetical protein
MCPTKYNCNKRQPLCPPNAADKPEKKLKQHFVLPMNKNDKVVGYYCQRTRLGDVAVFENRQPVTAAKFIK